MANFKKGEWITNGEVTGRYYDVCFQGIALQDYKVYKGSFFLCTQEQIDAYVEVYGYPKMPIEKTHLLVDEVYQWLQTWEQLKDTSIPIRFKEIFKNKH